jgi:hypothetical protein
VIKTTRFCDKCDNEVAPKEQLWIIRIERRLERGHDYSTPVLPDKHLCRPCMEELHILPATAPDKPKPDEPPTFEQLIRAVVREELNGE